MAGDHPYPPAALSLALSGLPEMGPARLLALVEHRQPAEAWAEVIAGEAHRGPASALLEPNAAALAARWARAAASIDVAAIWDRHRAAGVAVAHRDDPSYPAVLRDDPHGPALLTWQGDLRVLDGPRAAIVGTRDCTHAGRAFAVDLGRDLADAGVRVVSGLALGIDGAAHTGALASGVAPPIAVVGSGLDVVYPRRHAELWASVAANGVVISEHAIGAKPVAWHFLARNRIIATLADVVVVVESHARGGALQTATQAALRGRTVLAVPGSVRSAASSGTNALLRDDAHVCCDASDVLVLLGLVAPRARERQQRREPDGLDGQVLGAIGDEPSSTETLMLRTGLSLADVAMALGRLEDSGWIARRGAWCERVQTPRTSR